MDSGRARLPELVTIGWDPNRLLRWTKGSVDYRYENRPQREIWRHAKYPVLLHV